MSLLKNVGQPSCCYPTQTETCPVPVGGKALVTQLRYLRPFHMRHQKRRIINSFIRYGKLFSHIVSLPQFSKLV